MRNPQSKRSVSGSERVLQSSDAVLRKEFVCMQQRSAARARQSVRLEFGAAVGAEFARLTRPLMAAAGAEAQHRLLRSGSGFPAFCTATAAGPTGRAFGRVLTRRRNGRDGLILLPAVAFAFAVTACTGRCARRFGYL